MTDEKPVRSERALPQMQPVQSSNIKAVGHDGKDLFVQFHSGATWRYAEVPKATFDEMRAHHSVGSYFAKFIRPNHAAECVSTPPPEAA